MDEGREEGDGAGEGWEGGEERGEDLAWDEEGRADWGVVVAGVGREGVRIQVGVGGGTGADRYLSS